jgi:hypothetical protein
VISEKSLITYHSSFVILRKLKTGRFTQLILQFLRPDLSFAGSGRLKTQGQVFEKI